MRQAKKRIFYVVTLLVPIVFFVLLEVILRALNYGEQPPLFIDDVSSEAYRVLNPEASERFFPKKEYSTQGQYDVFLKSKTDNTLRIVVQGASSSAGFPYNHSGSFPRLLEQKLQHYYPQLHVEVINTSLAATNSYTLLDFADEIIAEQPDLILIYGGHNEYYGALGVGSSQRFAGSVGLTNIYLKLKHVRIIQLLKNTIQSFYNTGEDFGNETLMAKMVQNESIPYGSDAYEQGLKQYKTNISLLLEKYREKDIPVMFSNLVSNIKDFEPFITSEGESNNAQATYELAIKEYANGNYEKAKKTFQSARDFDLLKFRAPTALVEEIPLLAKQHDAQFIDMRGAFEKESSHGIVGNELLLEHVHANLKGTRLFANVMFDAISQWLNEQGREMSPSDDRFKYKIATVDSLYGTTLIQQLLSNWPFTSKTQGQVAPPKNEIERLIAGEIPWVVVMNNAFTRQIKEDPENALETALVMVQEYPHTAQPFLMVGEAYYKMGAYDEAVNFLSQMPAVLQSTNSYRLQLNARLEQGNYQSALPIAKKMLALKKTIDEEYVVAALTDITAISLQGFAKEDVLLNPNKYLRALGALAYLKRTEEVKSLNMKLERIIPNNASLNQLQETLKL